MTSSDPELQLVRHPGISLLSTHNSILPLSAGSASLNKNPRGYTSRCIIVMILVWNGAQRKHCVMIIIPGDVNHDVIVLCA